MMNGENHDLELNEENGRLPSEHDQLPSVDEYKAGIGHKSSMSMSFTKSDRPDPKGSTNSDPYGVAGMTVKTGSFNEFAHEYHDQMSNENDVKHIINQNSSTDGKFWKRFAVATLAIGVILAIVLPAALIDKNKDQGHSDRGLEAVSFLKREGISSEIDLITPGTPHFKAVKWLADDDGMRMEIPNSAYISSRPFIERYVYTLLYFALGGPEWTHQLDFLNNEHVCTWYADFIDKTTDQVITFGIHGCKRDEASGELYPFTLFIRKYTSWWFLPSFSGDMSIASQFDPRTFDVSLMHRYSQQQSQGYNPG
jgi:hypothetical protein